MNELGVGLIYVPGSEHFLASHSSLIDVLEIEPQTFWQDKNDECDAFKYDLAVTDFLRSYKCPKLFHGVGYPIGGTFPPSKQQFNTLKQQATILNPEWISEHLSFNIFNDGGQDINAGFLLPPLQSKEGVKVAVANIRRYRSEMNLPFAFETGVNYLQPRKNAIPDGLFVKTIAEEADCDILLDLHNILANQRNGRQSVKEFLGYLPYERIIELHIAGGIYYKDYYLDAHSGASDRELLAILENLIGRLPNLKALIFEITPEYQKKVPESEIVNQLMIMRRIWDKRGKRHKTEKQKAAPVEQCFDETISVKEWEYTVGRLVLGKSVESQLANELINDDGIMIINDLIFNFRGSVLISILQLTTRLLRLCVGEAVFNDYVLDFFDKVSPDLFPVAVAEQFSGYIKSNKITVPYLEKILEYELATVHTAIDHQNRAVSFDFDPSPVITALKDAKLPTQPVIKTVNLQIVFDESSLQSESLQFNPVLHI